MESATAGRQSGRSNRRSRRRVLIVLVLAVAVAGAPVLVEQVPISPGDGTVLDRPPALEEHGDIGAIERPLWSGELPRLELETVDARESLPTVEPIDVRGSLPAVEPIDVRGSLPAVEPIDVRGLPAIEPIDARGSFARLTAAGDADAIRKFHAVTAQLKANTRNQAGDAPTPTPNETDRNGGSWRASSGDIDGDGIPDAAEANCPTVYPDADPFHQDIYVEVDSVRGVSVSDEALRRVETAYANAPVQDPRGNRGLDLHLRRSDDDLPTDGPISGDRRPGPHNDIDDYRRDYMDHEDHSYYYLIVAESVRDDDRDVAGVARSEVGAIEGYDDPAISASLIAHELGHMFGIDKDDPGVDSHEYDIEAYPSVMNYEGLYEEVEYSDGSGTIGRNEWAEIAQNRPLPAGTCDPDEPTGGEKTPDEEARESIEPGVFTARAAAGALRS